MQRRWISDCNDKDACGDDRRHPRNGCDDWRVHRKLFDLFKRERGIFGLKGVGFRKGLTFCDLDALHQKVIVLLRKRHPG